MRSSIESLTYQPVETGVAMGYIRKLLVKGDIAELEKIIGVLREILKKIGDKGETENILSALQALGVIENLYQGPVNISRCMELKSQRVISSKPKGNNS